MGRVEVVPAHAGHVGTIAARMRDIDRMEVAAFGRTPKRALRLGIMGSTIAMTAKVEGKPEAMFGVVPVSLLDGLGSPWFLGTDEVYRHGRELVAWGPELVGKMLDSSPHLSNVVMAANGRAIRLLRRWGFVMGDEAKMIGGHAFLDFWMDR